MRRLLLASGLAIGILLGAASPAVAHPLGNFTINVYTGIVVRPEEVLIDYVVDMAEIPAFQERARIDRNGDGQVGTTEGAAYQEMSCARLAAGLTLTLGSTPAITLATKESALSFPPGTGGLSTLRLECLLSTPLTTSRTAVTLSFHDGNFDERIGWREVTAIGDGMTLVTSDVPTESLSDRLTSYPPASPLDVTGAEVRAQPGGPRLAALPGPGDGGPVAPAPGRNGGVLAALAADTELSIPLVALMFVVALGVGALHALGPGHGKTLIGAYLVAGGGTIRQAIGVGCAVSVMHTASVLGLGLVVVSAEQVLPPERIYPWLGLAAGLVALALGSTLLVSRIHAAGWRSTDGHNEDHHDHPHEHPAPQTDATLSRRGLVALAFAGGILPSPSALVVLLTSISLGRTGLGLVLIAAFSVGLAGSLIAVGALTLRARSLASRRLPSHIVGWAPIGSAASIALIGLVLTIRGLIQV